MRNENQSSVINHYNSMLTQVRDSAAEDRQIGGPAGSEFTAHLRQDEAMPSTLTSAPILSPIHPPILLSVPYSLPSLLSPVPFPFPPSTPLPLPVNQLRWLPGPVAAGLLFPGAGPGRTGSARI